MMIRKIEMKIIKLLLVFSVLGFSLLLLGQDQNETLINDEFQGQMVPASQFFDKWLNEYVKWIILPEETEEFEKLTTIQDKLAFIDLFWMKRDPVIETFFNEFKQDYYERLRFIANNFGYMNIKGVDTHRGMVYAVLGQPQYVDENFTIDASQFRYGDRFSRRGIVWVYGQQEGVNIPAYYQILFLKFGSNRYEIVADYWGQKSTVDALLDNGIYGRQGYVPHRLENILKEKRNSLIKNSNIEELKAKIQSGGQFKLTGKKMICTLGDPVTAGNWKSAVCKIKYSEMIFTVEDGFNVAELEGDVVIKVKDKSQTYSLPKTAIRLSDEELKNKFGEEFVMTIEIPSAPEKDKFSVFAEIRDTKSGAVYETMKEEPEKDK